MCVLFQMCEALDIEYISAHVWVGVWLFIISLVVVATDGGVLVRIISRFTEEIFSALISLLFIYETFYKLYVVSAYYHHHMFLYPFVVRFQYLVCFVTFRYFSVTLCSPMTVMY